MDCLRFIWPLQHWDSFATAKLSPCSIPTKFLFFFFKPGFNRVRTLIHIAAGFLCSCIATQLHEPEPHTVLSKLPRNPFFFLRIPQGIYLYLHRSMLQLYFLRPPGGPTFHRGGQQPTIDLSARALAKSSSSIWHNPYISIKMEWPNTHTLACTCTNTRTHSSHPTWYGSCGDDNELVATDFWWGNGETGRIPDSRFCTGGLERAGDGGGGGGGEKAWGGGWWRRARGLC